MPFCSHNLNLLEESSEFPIITMDPQLATSLAIIRPQVDALTQTMNQTQERLGRVETYLENRNERKEELIQIPTSVKKWSVDTIAEAKCTRPG